MTDLNVQVTFDALQSHALASGVFDRVNTHEPANPPGNGLTAAIWADSIAPVALASGLAVTSARVVYMVRVYSSTLQRPADAIDPAVMAAVDALMTAYSGDFDLGGTIRNVDLLGAHGAPLGAQAGYLPFPDGPVLRVMTITVPVIVNDAFVQAA